MRVRVCRLTFLPYPHLSDLPCARGRGNHLHMVRGMRVRASAPSRTRISHEGVLACEDYCSHVRRTLLRSYRRGSDYLGRGR